jgi:hypothetical protein
MTNNSQMISIKNHNDDWMSSVFAFCKGEIVIDIFDDNVRLSDIIHGYDNRVAKNPKPIKRIKIGNGGTLYNELKSIVILDNADFIIADKDGNIIDYIVNSNPIDSYSIREE